MCEEREHPPATQSVGQYSAKHDRPEVCAVVCGALKFQMASSCVHAEVQLRGATTSLIRESPTPSDRGVIMPALGAQSRKFCMQRQRCMATAGTTLKFSAERV